jgi:hypothetical protein
MLTATLRLTLVGAVAIAGFSLGAEPAEARTQVVSSSSCFTEGDHPGDYGFVNGITNFSSGLGWRPRRIVCPLAVGASIDSETISSLFVDGFDGNNENRSESWARGRACIMSFSGGAASCSGMQNLTNLTTTGSFSASMSTAVTFLNAANDFHYASLHLFLPSHGVLGFSQIFGFTVFSS